MVTADVTIHNLGELIEDVEDYIVFYDDDFDGDYEEELREDRDKKRLYHQDVYEYGEYSHSSNRLRHNNFIFSFDDLNKLLKK